jgi:arylsulfatase A
LVDFSDFFPTFCDLAGFPVDTSMDLDGISFYPELTEKKGPKRKWIHTWYNRDGCSNPFQITHEWVRNENYKMYVGDRFYNVKKDPYEKNNIPFSEMSTEEKGIRKDFIEALDSYTYLRN